jgi:hypothetical protein
MPIHDFASDFAQMMPYIIFYATCSPSFVLSNQQRRQNTSQVLVQIDDV